MVVTVYIGRKLLRYLEWYAARDNTLDAYGSAGYLPRPVIQLVFRGPSRHIAYRPATHLRYVDRSIVRTIMRTRPLPTQWASR